MNVASKKLQHCFIEHKVSKYMTTWYENGSLRVGGGMYFRRDNMVDVSVCGKHWCFISESVPSAILIFDAIAKERASFPLSPSQVSTVHFTPHTTILVRTEDDTGLTEIDIDGRELRRIHFGAARTWMKAVCTHTHIVLVSTCLEVYDYGSGTHVSTFPRDSICMSSLLYSPYTRKLYAQTDTQKALRAFCIQEDGSIVPDKVIPLHTCRTGLNHWSVLENEEVVSLRDLSGEGICFRNTKMYCEKFGISRMCGIPGGFFLVGSMCVYFILDGFSFTRKEMFVRACLQ